MSQEAAFVINAAFDIGWGMGDAADIGSAKDSLDITVTSRAVLDNGNCAHYAVFRSGEVGSQRAMAIDLRAQKIPRQSGRLKASTYIQEYP